MKNQKGITLAVLIITVIVLIILAGVSVNTITKSNLLNETKNMQESYEHKSSETEQKLQELKEEGLIGSGSVEE